MFISYCVHRRKACIPIIIILWINLITTIFFLGPEFLTNHFSISHLAERQIRVKYLESIHRSRDEEVTILLQYFVNLTEAASFAKSGRIYRNNQQTNFVTSSSELNTFNVSQLNFLSTEARIILKLSIFYVTTYPEILHLPRTNFLPKLLSDPASLQFSYLLSKNRTGFTIALGIPTVKREQLYITSTIENIIANMNNKEQQETLIIIHIGESNIDFILSLVKEIEEKFLEYLDQGLIEIIAPLASYYPMAKEVRITLDDTLDRIHWRSKENLDVSFLIAYARSKANFYVQLEDDVIVTQGFINIMKKFAYEMSYEKKSWFMLDFSQFGSIGKLFKSHDLPWLITYLQIFHYEKPIDWLISEINEIKTCDTIDPEWCISTGWLTYNQSLFQHIGLFSSFTGRMTRSRDPTFRRI